MEKTKAHVLVSGLVQGVFFRAATVEEANRFALTGWVRNLPTGEVEALFEGEKKQVEAMIAWCHKGPPGARVRSVEVTWENYCGDFADFRVVR